MRVTTNIGIDDGIAIVTIKGEVSKYDLLSALLEAGALAEQAKTKRLMLVLLDADLRMSAFDIYHLPALLREHGFARGMQLAAVLNGNWPHGRFFSTVLFNNGFAVRVFATTETAVDWLKDHAVPPQPRTVE